MADTIILKVNLQNEEQVIAGLQNIDKLADKLRNTTIKLKLDGATKEALAFARAQEEAAKAQAQAAKAQAESAKAQAQASAATQKAKAQEAKAQAQSTAAEQKARAQEAQLATARERTAAATQNRIRAEAQLATQVEKTNTVNSQQVLEDKKLATEQARLATQQERTRTAAENHAAAQDRSNKSMKDGAKSAGLLGDSLGHIVAKVAAWQAINGAVAAVKRSFTEALETMKAVDTELKTIQKVTDMSDASLKKLGDTAYSTASKYGIAADEYLQNIATFSKAGYGDLAEGLGELAIKTQLVGDVNAETASKFLLSMDAAYKYNGSVEALSAVLDKANAVENNYATSIEKIAEGTPIVASVAEMANITAEETIAALGTITAKTQESGTSAARAFRALILNIIGDTKTEIEDGVTWSAGEIESLNDVLWTYSRSAMEAAQASGEIVNPMEAIAGLSQAMKDGLLTEAKLAEIASSLGGKLRTNQLVALIEGWDTVIAMLGTMETAAGSADKEVETMLGSWEKKTQVLENTWTELIANVVDTDLVKGVLDGVTGILSGINGLFDSSTEKAREYSQTLQDTYSKDFGEGSRYDELISKQEKRNELEEYELYLWEQRKKKIEEEQAAARDAEYEAWQKDYGTGKRTEYLYATDESYTNFEWKSASQDVDDLYKFKTAVRDLNNGLAEGKITVSEYQNGIGSLADTYSDTIGTLKEYKEEGRELSESQLTLIDSFDMLVNASITAENFVAQYGLAMAAYFQAAGYSAEESAQMATQSMAAFSQQIDNVPEETATDVEVDTGEAEGKLKTIISYLDNINGKDVEATVSIIANLPQFASGTKDAPGGPALVNEKGPELISANGLAYIAGGGQPTITTLPKGATVLTAEQTRKAVGGLGSVGRIRAYKDGTNSSSNSIFSRAFEIFQQRINSPQNSNTVWSPTSQKSTATADGKYIYCARCGRPVLATTKICPYCGADPRTGEIPKNTSPSGGGGKGTYSAAPDFKALEDELDDILSNLEAQAELADNQGLHSKEGDLYGQAREKIQELLDKYRAAGYSETSDEVLELQNMLYDYAEQQEEAYRHTWDELEDGLDTALDNINAQIEKAENENDIDRQMALYGQAQEKIGELLNQYLEAGFDPNSDEVLRLANLGYDYAGKQTKLTESLLDDLIDALNGLKDTTDRAKSLEEKQLAVEEAQKAYEAAQNQRTVRIFNPVTGQWEWVAKASDVLSAQKNLESAQDALREEQFSQAVDRLKRGELKLEDLLLDEAVSSRFSAASDAEKQNFLSALGAYSGGVNYGASTAFNNTTNSQTDSHDIVYNFNGFTIGKTEAEGMTLAQLAAELRFLKLT